MRKAHAVKLLKKVGLIGMALNLLAFTSPKKDDLVELRGLFNARKDSETFMKNVNTNKVHTLPRGTRAVVVDVTRKESGNYGVCLKVQNISDLDSNHKCLWVYYDRENPNMEFYRVGSQPEKQKAQLEAWAKDSKMTLKGQKVSEPTVDSAAKVTKESKGVPESVPAPKAKTGSNKISVSIGFPSASKPAPAVVKPAAPAALSADAKKEAVNNSQVDVTAVATAAVTTATNVAQNMNNRMSSSNQVCPTGNCSAPPLEGYGSCTSKNNYLESALDKVLNQSAYSAFFKSPQKELITTKCIKDNMTYFPSTSAFYKHCGPKQSTRRIVKACVSEDYVNVTSKSFNLAADCLGGFVSGNEQTKGQTAMSIFSLMAQESGMHTNAVSPTGPGGPGQMSGGAITAVNSLLKNVRQHIQSQSNPNCSQVLGKVLEKPMKTGTCDRISIDNDNPIKSMAYAFVYQSVTRKVIQSVLNERLYPRVLGGLDAVQKERLAAELSAWAHNTGPAGMRTPLSAQLADYSEQGKSLKTAADVDAFLKETRTYMMSNPNSINRGSRRIVETREYYGEIQKKLAKFTKDRNACLAN